MATTNDSSSIFKNGKLEAGIYKIQNLRCEYYLDIHKHSKEVCCRAEPDLKKGRGLWEIVPLGVGYAVKMAEDKPDQFCNPREGVSPGTPLFVTAYPAAWRIERVDDPIHQGLGYVRIFWGPTRKTWDQAGMGSGQRVELHDVHDKSVPWQTWILIPQKVEGSFTPSQSLPKTVDPSIPPSNAEDVTEPSTQTRHAEYERDDFGTIVTEVTTVTNTIITRKKYRVEDA